MEIRNLENVGLEMNGKGVSRIRRKINQDVHGTVKEIRTVVDTFGESHWISHVRHPE